MRVIMVLFLPPQGVLMEFGCSCCASLFLLFLFLNQAAIRWTLRFLFFFKSHSWRRGEVRRPSALSVLATPPLNLCVGAKLLGGRRSRWRLGSALSGVAPGNVVPAVPLELLLRLLLEVPLKEAGLGGRKMHSQLSPKAVSTQSRCCILLG